jgi:thymidylate synthase
MSQQYIDLVNRIIDTGKWVKNERTGARCLTVIDANLEYDCREGQIALLTTKKAYWRKAVAEMLGYWRGYDNVAEFQALGTDTWDANANAPIWKSSRFCRRPGDMGRVYGVQGRNWGHNVDQLKKVYEDLRKGLDDRGEIITYWNPGELNQGCLRPCLYQHIFSVLDGTLYLTSYQRSADVPLGLGFNMIQVCWLLMVMAKITGLKPGIAYHKIVNAHIYENQMLPLRQQLSRKPFDPPSLIINPKIETLEDMDTWVTVDDFQVINYQHHPAIAFEFSV